MKSDTIETAPADAFTKRFVNTVEGPTMLTIDGDYFNLLDPWHSVISINAIAHGLANCCRFAGQCREFYSVAQHSYLASLIVPQKCAFEALMQDAAEAFLGDMTRPLKNLIPQFREIEADVEAAIFARFGINKGYCQDEIKAADIVMLATEQRDLMHKEGGDWPVTKHVKPMAGIISPWPPLVAKAAFLLRFRELYQA